MKSTITCDMEGVIETMNNDAEKINKLAMKRMNKDNPKYDQKSLSEQKSYTSPDTSTQSPALYFVTFVVIEVEAKVVAVNNMNTNVNKHVFCAHRHVGKLIPGIGCYQYSRCC